MGSGVSTLFSPFATWSTAQLVFGVVWPCVIIWFIMKFIVEKRYTPSPALTDFQELRKKGFQNFRMSSDPRGDAVLRRNLGEDGGTTDELIAKYNAILELDFEALREALQRDDYKAITVMSAFVWRAMQINDKINCITQVISDAFEKAQQLDENFYKNGRPKGPLHGLPFSVKSNFDVKDYPVTIGLEKLLSSTRDTTCPFVQHLTNLGAVPFCLTNVPQGLLSYISSNPIYGTTANPWDFGRTPGGSSGGEAALLAAGGAAFGTGSDLAGSLRIPAAFCGLVTLKPTQERLVTTGTHGGLPGRGRLGLSFGFYTRNVKDQEYLLRQIIGNREYRKLCRQSSPAQLDPTLLEGDPQQKLRIGYFTDDGFHPAVPSQKRAVDDVVGNLRREGYECVEFNLQDIVMSAIVNGKVKEFKVEDYANMLFRNVMPDNGAYMANEIYGGEKYDRYMSPFIWPVRINQWIPTIISWFMPIVRRCISTRLAILASSRNNGIPDVRRNQENTDKFKISWDNYWKELKIDALICPSFITPAQEFAYPAQLSTGAFLTGLFNMLDVPAGVVPVGHVTEQDITNLRDPAHFNIDGDQLLAKQKATCLETQGLPTAVQVVTQSNEEEMCLRVMRIVENTRGQVQRLKWKGRDDHPGPNATGKQKSEWYFERAQL